MRVLRLAGRCPACAIHGALEVDDAGTVTCQDAICPDRTLLHDFLNAVDHDDQHRVTITPDNWFLEHSLRCRIEGLADCEVHEDLIVFPPALRPGRYVVELHQFGANTIFTEIHDG